MILLKKFLTVSGMTAISRVLGVIREMLFSKYLGASSEMDACLIAMKFPKFFKKCFSEEGFNSIFVPYLSELEIKNKNIFAQLFSSRVFTIICYIALAITLTVVIFAKQFVILMAPGFSSDPEKLAFAIDFTRIMFPSVFFLSINAIYSAVLISNQKFAWYTICPLIMNIILIAFIIISKNSVSPGTGISYGVLFSVIAQSTYLFIVLKIKKLTIPKFNNKVHFTPIIKQFFKKITPVIASAGVAQINVFVDSFFSSYLFTGCITYLYFADRLNQLPLALFGISMSIILLPEISRKIATKDDKNLPLLYKDSILFTLRLTFPVMVIISCLSYYFVNLIYGHGKFTQVDVQNTATVLKIMCLGLPAYVLSKIISAILFAKKNVKTPIRAALFSICANVILNCLLIYKFKFVGIAISTMISGYVQTLVLSRYLKEIKIFNKRFIIDTAKIIISTISMSVVIVYFKNIIHINFENQVVSDISNICICSVISIIAYAIALYFCKDTALKKLCTKLTNKRLVD